jgi:pseudouridine kinase
MLDLISIGDTTIDNFLKIHDAEVAASLDKTKRMLFVEYGSKVMVDEFNHSVGGNAAHSAIGASRLKLKTAIYTNIGSDFSDNQIIKKLKQENVSTKYVAVNEGMESNLSTILTFKGERTIFSYHQNWHYNLPDLEPSKWVYFTSLAKTFVDTNLIADICSYLERTGANLLYNPGTFQIKYGIKKFPKLLLLTTVFIVNLEESKRILGYENEKNIPIKKLLKDLIDLGPKMVIITDASKGSFGYDGKTFYSLGVFPVEVKEMTGAGDAYATGLLGGLFYGLSLKDAMRWGAANSSSVIGQIGPQGGLLTYHKMQEVLRQNSKIIAKDI